MNVNPNAISYDAVIAFGEIVDHFGTREALKMIYTINDNFEFTMALFNLFITALEPQEYADAVEAAKDFRANLGK